MQNTYSNTFYFILIFCVSPMLYAVDHYSCAEWKEYYSNKGLYMKVTYKDLEEKVEGALDLIESGVELKKALSILENAAESGSSNARYRLGWLYLQNFFADKSGREALKYLESVKGEYDVSAKILIGVVYAKGSQSIPVDLIIAKNFFIEAQEMIQERLEFYKTQNRPDQCDNKELMLTDMRNRQELYNASIMLSGFAERYGINLNIKGQSKK